MNKEAYSAKHKTASNDYKSAYDIVGSLEPGMSDTYQPDNIKVFRKYIYDLALKQDKEMATRLNSDKISLLISRLR